LTRAPRLRSVYPPDAFLTRLRLVFEGLVDDWGAVELVPGSEKGLRVERPSDILDAYLSVLFVTGMPGKARLAAAMLSHYAGSDVMAVRFLDVDVMPGPQVVPFHPSLATKRARAVNTAEAAWGLVAQNDDTRAGVIDLCSQVIEGCTGLETLRVRGTRIMTIRIKGHNNRTYFIPLETLGDGQRSLLLLGLLASYASLLRGERLLIADTPEAYTHPDLQRLTASLLAGTAKKLNVLTSTQSLELLQELLAHADIEGTLGDTRLLRLRTKREPHGDTMLTRISYEALSGEEAYSLVEQEGLDVRLYKATA